MTEGQIIWDLSRIPDRETTRIELTSLVRYKAHWYCGFREGEIHLNHPSGRARIIRSSDGEHWETAALFTWEGGDVREPKLSITPDGALMVNTSIYFVSREPRADGRYYQLEKTGTVLNMPHNDREAELPQQSVSWFSRDGVNWSSAYAPPEGANTWLWDTAWHNGMGYSVAQWGKDHLGTLYRTRDGKSWRPLKEAFCPGGKCNEGGIAFGLDDTAYCLLRRGNQEEKVMLGIGKAPCYTDWTWKPLQVDWHADGCARPVESVFRVSLGGPTILRLSDGRLVGAGRTMGPGQDDGHAMVFWVDPQKGLLTKFFECKGTSYPSLAEHDGMLWVTFCSFDVSSVHLAKIPIPS